jgi:hypothetical protein
LLLHGIRAETVKVFITPHQLGLKDAALTALTETTHLQLEQSDLEAFVPMQHPLHVFGETNGLHGDCPLTPNGRGSCPWFGGGKACERCEASNQHDE